MLEELKICGVQSLCDAYMLIEQGVRILGYNCVRPEGPRYVSESEAAKIISNTPAGVQSYLLTSARSAEIIVSQVDRIRPTAIQIVAPIDPVELKAVRNALVKLKIVQVIHICDENDINMIEELEDIVDEFILDSGGKGDQFGRLGGTGNTHDWAISSEFVRRTKRPVFLAGGINSSNVLKAVHVVKPYGIDLSSGVRENGKLNAEKVRELVAVLSS